MVVFLTIAFIIAVSAAAYGSWLFDKLVRWEYENHRSEWERDGKPDGYFWRPAEATRWASDNAKKRLGLAWLFITPQWIETQPKCRS